MLSLNAIVFTFSTSLEESLLVSLCDNCQRQSCKAFIGLTNRAKMIGGGDPFHLKFWIKLTALERNRRFSLYFRS